MKWEAIIGGILALILIVAAFLKHQSSVDLDKEEDLKELHSITDLFMIH